MFDRYRVFLFGQRNSAKNGLDQYHIQDSAAADTQKSALFPFVEQYDKNNCNCFRKSMCTACRDVFQTIDNEKPDCCIWEYRSKVRGSRFGTLSFMAKYLHEHQCDVLFIEHRCCGDSEGKYITFGAKEQWDVQQWAVYVSERNKEKLPIYLYGQSMGAAAVLMASGHTLPAEVKGLIADCGFQSMEGQMRDMAANWFHLHHIPLLLMELDWFCSLLAGFHMKDADTAEAMKKNTRPVLFFHGEKDTYVYPNNSFQNYMLCRAEKELVIIPGARHLCSAYADPELYQHKMMEFFEKYD